MRRSIMFVFMLFLATNVSAETVELKSGKVVEGDIAERKDDHIRIIVKGVDLILYLDEIESIGSERTTPERVVDERREEPQEAAGTDLEGGSLAHVRELLEQKKARQAYKELKHMIRTRPDQMSAYYLLGEEFVLSALMRPEANTVELMHIFEKAVKVHPGDPECRFYLASLYTIMGRFYDARDAYAAARRLIDQGEQPRADYIVTAIDSGSEKIDRQIVELESEVGDVEAMSEAQKRQAAKMLIEKAGKSSDMGQIIKYSLYAVNVAPDSPDVAMAYTNLAGMYFSDEAEDIVKHFYNKAIELKPDLAEAHYGLGSIHASMGGMKGDEEEWDRSEESYDKAVSLFKEQGREDMVREIEEMRAQQRELRRRMGN